MAQIIQTVVSVRQFAKDSIHLVKMCTKPDKKEFQKIAIATVIRFVITQMGQTSKIRQEFHSSCQSMYQRKNS